MNGDVRSAGAAAIHEDDHVFAMLQATIFPLWGGAMLRSLAELKGYRIHAEDGDLGSVVDFYFDDREWSVRYVVVDLGHWLPSRKVLISPASIHGTPDWQTASLPVSLTREQVRRSPDTDAQHTVSRDQEEELVGYFGWPIYWQWSQPMILPPLPEDNGERNASPRLQSVSHVRGYHAEAADGQVGHVADFIVDDESWAIRSVVIDTRNWLPGKRVLIAPKHIGEISWPDASLHLELTKDEVTASRGYDPAEPVNRRLEEQLYDYYGRPRYW